MRERLKDTSGITLVALIITIIVLIIISAVTIKAMSESGIIGVAVEAAEKYAEAEQKELNEMKKAEDIIKGEKLEYKEGAIVFGDILWSAGKASITVTKTIEEDYTIRYKLIDKEDKEIVTEREIENGGRIEDLSFGDTVIAKLTSGSKEGNTASITIGDTNPPTAPTFGEISEEKGKGGWYKENTVTVRVNPGTDEE